MLDDVREEKRCVVCGREESAQVQLVAEGMKEMCEERLRVEARANTGTARERTVPRTAFANTRFAARSDGSAHLVVGEEAVNVLVPERKGGNPHLEVHVRELLLHALALGLIGEEQTHRELFLRQRRERLVPGLKAVADEHVAQVELLGVREVMLLDLQGGQREDVRRRRRQ
eukprot:1910620-Rhodomonas_salina.2